MSNSSRGQRHADRGSAAVEVALGLPLSLLPVTGMLDSGITYNQ
jgi:Flp pilus assembly protein TadG